MSYSTINPIGLNQNLLPIGSSGDPRYPLDGYLPYYLTDDLLNCSPTDDWYVREEDN